MSIDSDRRMPNDEFAEIYQGLSKELVHLHSRWKIFRQLYSTSEEQINFLREVAPGFFGLIQHSLRDDILLRISRLTDPATYKNKHERLSLEQLSKHLGRTVDSEFSSGVTASIEAIKSHCDSIRRDWRDRRIAHADLEDALHPTLKSFPEDEGKQIDEALEMIGDLLNQIAQHYGQPFVPYDTVYIEGDAEHVVTLLKYAVDAYKRDMEQKIKSAYQ